jgi:hypothetical protein
MKQNDFMAVRVLRRILLGIACVTLGLGAPSALAKDHTVKEDEELYTPYQIVKRLPSWEESSLVVLRPAETDAARVTESIRAGALLVKYGQPDKALEYLEPLRSMDHFTLQHALGVAYVRLNRNQEAYDSLMRAHLMRPSVAGPLLPAALACARMARRCYEYRDLALEYRRLGGRFLRMADRIAYHVPYVLRKY